MLVHDLCVAFFFFFFSSRRRHTRLVSDWSSVVCSSDLPSITDAQRVGDKYYYLEAPPGSKDRLLMMRAVAGGSARLLLNPALLGTSSSHAAITYFQPSWDGGYVVAGVSLGGSEDATIRIVQTS